VCMRRPENIAALVKHMQSQHENGKAYVKWIVQEFITNPLCVIGKELTMVRARWLVGYNL
jgi:hypothetical protein